ncbi:Uncharacterised protein [Fusobacterium necrophorum subsp. necrophorum]|nr:Uncharacterised protein [Fusobacterium necrophorum subsp. necrophorum]
MGKEASKYGKNILMVYEKVVFLKKLLWDFSLSTGKREFRRSGTDNFELPNIDPNPRIESVMKEQNYVETVRLIWYWQSVEEVPLIVRKLLRDRQNMKGIFGNVMKVRIRDRCKKSYPCFRFNRFCNRK